MNLQQRISLRGILLALALFVMNTYAQTTTVNGMTFARRSDGTASLMTVGTSAPIILTVPGKVTINGNECIVTHVAKGAFKGDKRITSITFSEGLKVIEELAIENCTKVTTINLPASLENWNHSLYKCTLLATYNVASGNTNYTSENGILYNADKTKLIAAPRRQTTITFPATVTEIGDYAFEYTFASNITLPETITKIGKYAFTETSQITSMTLPASLTTLGEGVFYKCSGLTTINVASGNKHFSVVDNVLYDFAKKTLLFVPATRTAALTLPPTVTSIASKAAYSSKISGVNFPVGLTSIGAEAFYACSSIGAINLPASLIEIGTNAFSSAGVSTYTVADGNTVYSAQSGVLYNANKTTLLHYPSRATIAIPELPTTLTRIETNAFANTLVTGNLVIPTGVTELGDGVFGNTQLQSITLPEGITAIPANTFSMSTELKTIVLPSTVSSISTSVFAMCNSLTDVEYRGKNLPTIGSLLPSNVVPVKLHVRVDAAFEASKWGNGIQLQKDLEVVPLTMSSYKYATFHWADKNYALPVALRGATIRMNGNAIEPRYDFKGGDVVNKNVALLLNGEAGAYDLVETKFAPASTVDVSGNLLFGRDKEERYTATKGHVFTLTTKNSAIGFYWQKGTNGTYANLKLHRGYIDVNAPAGVQGFNLDGDFITAIEGLEAETVAPQAPIYDLGGRAVQKPTRGLYIVNGKKVLF